MTPIFYHQNIDCNRPFKDAEEMNEKIIDNWNKTVKGNDVVYHLGDVIFVRRGKYYTQENADFVKTFFRRLNGKLILITGSHDDIFRQFPRYLVTEQHELLNTKIGKQKITMCHYPMDSWFCSHYGSWQLFGHHHGRRPENPNKLQCDVGVDAWDFTPVSFEQITAKMATKTFVPLKSRREISSARCANIPCEKPTDKATLL